MNPKTQLLGDLRAKIAKLEPEAQRLWEVFEKSRKDYEARMADPPDVKLPHRIAQENWHEVYRKVEALKKVLSDFEAESPPSTPASVEVGVGK